MPELPEVEVMTRQARRWALGRTIAGVEVPDPLLEVPALSGLAVHGVRRRGKHLLLDLAGGQHLLLHFRMTGKLVRDPGERRARLSLRLDDGSSLVLVDPRRFAQVELLDAPGLSRRLARLGPDPWPARRAAAWWAGRLAGARGAVKPALMDQSRLAGIGNIGAAEACWRAGVDPRRPVASLGEADWAQLQDGVHAWIAGVLATEGEGELRYLNADGAPNPFLVYGRAGKPCPRCGRSLERIVQAGRSTFFCGSCQR